MEGQRAGQKIAQIARDHSNPILTREKIRRASGTTAGKYLIGGLGTAVLVMLAVPSRERSLPPRQPSE